MSATPTRQAMKAIAAAPPKKILVPAVPDMDDETFIRHLELRHPEDLEMTFTVRPGETRRVMETRLAFEALHALRHRDRERTFDHDHKEPIQHERDTQY